MKAGQRCAAWRWMVVCAIATVAAALVPVVQGGPASGEGGDLDPGYGDGGIALFDAGLSSEEAGAVSLLPNGEIAVVGVHRVPDGQNSSQQRAPLVRFDPAGQVLPTANDRPGHQPKPVASAATPDGKVVVAAMDGGDSAPTVLRYLPSGALDPSFRGALTGPRNHSLRGDALGVAVAPDGSVLVTGRARDLGTNAYDLLVARLLPDGREDPAFAGGDAVILGIEADGSRADVVGQSIARLPDGRIVVAGTIVDQYGAVVFLARFTARGELDRSFNQGVGFTVGPAGDDWIEIAGSLAVLPDGRIVVGGTRLHEKSADLFLRRHLADGRIDPAFAGGTATVGDAAIDEVLTGLAIDAAGRVVFSGSAARDGGPADVLLGRQLPDGRPDAGFAGGLARVDVGGDDLSAGVVLDQGRPVVAATAINAEGGDIAVLRFTDTGQADTSFGASGRAFGGFAAYSDASSGMAVAPDGAVISVGNATFPGNVDTRRQAFVARQRPDGRPDRSFRRWGVAFVGSDPWQYTLNDAVVLPDGSAVAAGGRWDRNKPESERVLVRLRPDGSLDPSFGNGGEVLGGRDGDRCCEPFEALAVMPDGRLRALVLASGRGSIIVAGFLPDGRPDPGFGTAGLAVIPRHSTHGDWDLALAPDGSVLIGGGDGGSFNWSLIKLTAAGKLDESFAPELSPADGETRFRAMTPAPDGTVVVAGLRTSREDGTTQLLVRRLTADGKPDPGFDCDGLVSAPFLPAGQTATIAGVAIGADGRIVVGGQVREGQEPYHERDKPTGVFAARWLADGSRDTGFSADGLASTMLSGPASVSALGLAGDRPVLVGSMTSAGERPQSDGFAVRFGPGGPPPAPEPVVDRLVRCGTTALSAGDLTGVVQATAVAAGQILASRPAPPALRAPPGPPVSSTTGEVRPSRTLRALATATLPFEAGTAIRRPAPAGTRYAPVGRQGPSHSMPAP